MVLVFSGAANSSPEVRREVQLAAQNRIGILPIRLVDLQPADGLAYLLAGIHWIDGFGDRGQRVLEELRNSVAKGEAVPPNRLRPVWMEPLELLGFSVLTLLSAWLLLGQHLGRPWVQERSHGVWLALVALALGLGLFLFARKQSQLNHRKLTIRSLAAYGMTIALLLANWEFRSTVLFNLTLDKYKVQNLIGVLPDPKGSESAQQPLSEEMLASIQGPIIVWRQDEVYAAQALFPPLDWLEAPLFDRYQIRKKKRSLLEIIHAAPSLRLQIELRSEEAASAVSKTRWILHALFLAIIGAASLGHGYFLSLLYRGRDATMR